MNHRVGRKGVNSAEISSPDLRAIMTQSFKKALMLWASAALRTQRSPIAIPPQLKKVI